MRGYDGLGVVVFGLAQPPPKRFGYDGLEVVVSERAHLLKTTHPRPRKPAIANGATPTPPVTGYGRAPLAFYEALEFFFGSGGIL